MKRKIKKRYCDECIYCKAGYYECYCELDGSPVLDNDEACPSFKFDPDVYLGIK